MLLDNCPDIRNDRHKVAFQVFDIAFSLVGMFAVTSHPFKPAAKTLKHVSAVASLCVCLPPSRQLSLTPLVHNYISGLVWMGYSEPPTVQSRLGPLPLPCVHFNERSYESDERFEEAAEK